MANSHIQTVYASLFRKPLNISFTKKQFFLSDGDFLECYWHETNRQINNTPLVILFHGLAGSYKSPYIQGVVQELSNNGFNSVLMHFRGCTGNDNKLPRSYHSGDSGDALAWLNVVSAQFSHSKLFGVGYSIGGNMLLKLLGELGKKSPLSAAVSVSAPLQLDICADAMNRGFSKLYQHILLKSLNHSLEQKFEKHDMQRWIKIAKSDVSKIKTFWEFDGAYTAPIHGFTSAQDYYTRCSSKQFLKSIQTPTLIIHSSDDPFMTPAVLPKKEELSTEITFELSAHGGHVGFIAGSFLQPDYWLEKRIIHFLNTFRG